MSMRAQSGRGSSKLAGILVEYAHFARSTAVSFIVNSLVGHSLESLPVPLPQNIMSTYIIILRTGGCVPLYRSVSYQNCVGALPSQVKYWGGTCPPLPPPPPPSTTIVSLVYYGYCRLSVSDSCGGHSMVLLPLITESFK